MTTIDDYLNNIEKLLTNFDNEFEKVVIKNKDKILDLNREKQLFDLGIDSNGKRLIPMYSNYTIGIKRREMMPYNRVTLFDQGDFYRGFDFRIENDRILFFSRDSKSSDLQDKYGSSIFGLTKINQSELNYNLLLPDINNFIQKYL